MINATYFSEVETQFTMLTAYYGVPPLYNNSTLFSFCLFLMISPQELLSVLK